MTKSETLKFLEKISGTYPSQFFVTDAVKNTWIETLEPYALEDVEKKLQEYIRSDYERPPQLPNLIKHLRTQEEKRESDPLDYIIRCDICGKEMSLKHYETKHRDKCLLISALISKAKQSGREVSYEEFDRLSYEELDRKFGKMFEGKFDFNDVFKKGVQG